MSDGWGGDAEAFGTIFGGADESRARVISPGSDLTATDLEYYTGGPSTPLAPATPVMDGSLTRTAMGGSSADLASQSEQPAQGVQWGGAKLLEGASAGVGAVLNSAADLAGVVLNGVRRIGAAAAPAPAAPAQTGVAPLLAGWAPLLLLGGLGFLAYRYL